MAAGSSRFLLAVDPSLTCSGWALFALTDGLPRAVGVIMPPGPAIALATRIALLQREVEALLESFKLGVGDLLVCEGPAPLVLNPQSALKVEGVRGVFETVARSRGVAVPGRLNPRTVQSELLGMRGKQLDRRTVKEWARAAALQLYGARLDKLLVQQQLVSDRRAAGAGGDPPRPARSLSQDAIDALLIGAVAVGRFRLSVASGLPVETVFQGGGKRRSFAGGGKRGTGWSEGELQKLLQKK